MTTSAESMESAIEPPYIYSTVCVYIYLLFSACSQRHSVICSTSHFGWIFPTEIEGGELHTCWESGQTLWWLQLCFSRDGWSAGPKRLVPGSHLLNSWDREHLLFSACSQRHSVICSTSHFGWIFPTEIEGGELHTCWESGQTLWWLQLCFHHYNSAPQGIPICLQITGKDAAPRLSIFDFAQGWRLCTNTEAATSCK